MELNRSISLKTQMADDFLFITSPAEYHIKEARRQSRRMQLVPRCQHYRGKACNYRRGLCDYLDGFGCVEHPPIILPYFII